MTSFVHVDQPTVHPGVQRAEVLFGHLKAARGGSSARPLILLLIVAIVSAVLVVADTIVTHWDEGALLAAWALVCAGAFAVIALFAGSLANGANKLGAAWLAASQRRAAARADARFLDTAHSDPRVMAELQAAVWRQQSEGTASVADAARIDALAGAAARTQAARMPTLYEAMRRMNSSRYY